VIAISERTIEQVIEYAINKERSFFHPHNAQGKVEKFGVGRDYGTDNNGGLKDFGLFRGEPPHP
jgi:hypothetical protein